MSYPSNNRQVVPLERRVDLVLSNEQFFINASTDSKIKWQAEYQFAVQALQNNDYLARVADSNPASMQNAIINIASIGISLNPALKHAYLVPRKLNGVPAICLDISYMGMIHLAQATGSIKFVQAQLVCANDTYRNLGTGNAPEHIYQTFGDRGDVVGVYCVAKTFDDDFLVEEMSIADCHSIRNRSEAWKSSKGPSGPWVTDEHEMIRKTVVKRASKYWPKCERLSSAIQVLNESGEGFKTEKEVFEAPAYDDSQRLGLLQNLKETVSEACEKMELSQSISELEKVFKAAYRSVMRANTPDLEKLLNQCKNLNKKRFEVAV